jgi:hypothetical protein
MTQAMNLANFANNLDTSGGLNPSALNAFVPVSKGGTAATTAAGARSSLSAAVLGANNDITSLTGLTTPLSTSQGGTGSSSTTFANLTSNVTGTLPIGNGGTNSTATPTNGGAAYGTGTAVAYTAAGTAGQVLVSAGSGAPAWASSQSIGVGQSWQNVTRTAGTTYTNTTGRPIVTQCVILANTVQSYTLTVGSVVVAYYQGQYSPAQIAGTISAIIPPGATYVFTATGAPSVVNQIELR